MPGLSRRRSSYPRPARASPMSVPASRQGYGASRARSSSLYVLQTDNTRRVRDGYISESTSGHARAPATRSADAICRTNVLANDRACTPIPLQNLHGKEGVDGSSPSEGLLKRSAYCRSLFTSKASSSGRQTQDGHILGWRDSEERFVRAPLTALALPCPTKRRSAGRHDVVISRGTGRGSTSRIRSARPACCPRSSGSLG
jgi:hypothetical protein